MYNESRKHIPAQILSLLCWFVALYVLLLVVIGIGVRELPKMFPEHYGETKNILR